MVVPMGLKKRFKTKTNKNEFDEIRELKVKHVAPITKEDITDFQIDLGLYNQQLEKNFKKIVKTPKKNQGKKRCVNQETLEQESAKKQTSHSHQIS